MARALDRCTTILENLWWGWLLGFSSFELYADELVIVDIDDVGLPPDPWDTAAGGDLWWYQEPESEN